MELHPKAASGFGQEADTYEKARPSYPAQTTTWLKNDLGLQSSSQVLEVGAGTGKFTRFLLDITESVSVLEPVEAMRTQLAHKYPSVRQVHGQASSISLPDNSMDFIICAQSFHWFAGDEALREFHRVLKPNGRIGLIWNYRDDRVSWVARLKELRALYEGQTPQFHPGLPEQFFPNTEFGPLQSWSCEHGHTGDPEVVVVQCTRSVSFLAALPENEKLDFLNRVRLLVQTHPELQGKAQVTFPYITFFYRADAL